MFARFGSQARRVIVLAEDHARALRRPAVGPEHLLLALLAADESGVFARCGLRVDDVRARLLEAGEREAPGGDASTPPGALPLRLRGVFRAAFREAAFLGADEVAPVHLALALVEHPPGEIAALLRAFEVAPEALTRALRSKLLGDEAAERGVPDRTVVELRRATGDPGDPGDPGDSGGDRSDLRDAEGSRIGAVR